MSDYTDKIIIKLPTPSEFFRGFYFMQFLSLNFLLNYIKLKIS